jgi:hypothetical protein
LLRKCRKNVLRPTPARSAISSTVVLDESWHVGVVAHHLYEPIDARVRALGQQLTVDLVAHALAAYAGLSRS